MDLVLFMRGGDKHSKGSLTKFMEKKTESPLSAAEKGKLQRTFSFLSKAYRKGLKTTRLASEYAHFYTMSTSLIKQEIFPVVITLEQRKDLTRRLIEFGARMETEPRPLKEESKMGNYLLLSSKQTTDVKKREQREKLFKEILATERCFHESPNAFPGTNPRILGSNCSEDVQIENKVNCNEYTPLWTTTLSLHTW